MLAGDALHALAFDILTQADTSTDPFTRAELVAALAKASGHDGMAGGQMMDMAAEDAAYDLQQVTRLQQLKTGALLAASVEMGAILGRIPPEGRGPLRAYARDIGLAFQIADDILDVTGDPAQTGKRTGKDARMGKATFVSLLGLDTARDKAAAIVGKAVDALNAYPGGEPVENLRQLARFIIHRQT